MAELKNILLDTDIIIDHLRGFEKSTSLFNKVKSADVSSCISIVTLVELYSFSKMDLPIEIGRVENLLKYMSILNLDTQIAKTAGELRRKYSCSFPDAVIASTAYSFSLTLLTRNTKHYKMIKEINVIRPY